MKKLFVLFLIITACGGDETSTTEQSITTTEQSTTTSISKTIVEPKVIFLNCPSTNISNENYELKFQVDSGSGNIINIGIFEQKNGENNKNVFFDKEYNEDIFTFPEANTINEYSYIVDNVGNTQESNFVIEINVVSEDGSSFSSCEMTYNQSSNSSATDTQSINDDCPEKLLFDTPVDLNLVTSILYPGQIRANYFKPHGGFRFDGLGDNNNKITVKIPIDSFLVLGSRYVVEGQVQYMFEFNTACNVKFRLDHLLVLSPKLQEIADNLPAPKEGETRTTNLENVEFLKGEVIATEVGILNNVFVDFGIYDYRKENEASKTSELVKSFGYEIAKHAVCWFDWLTPNDEEIVRNLPPSGNDGSSSEYCKNN